MVETPEVVWHTTTGSEAVTIGPEPAPLEVEEVGVEVDGGTVVDGARVIDVVVRFGWVVPDVETGPDEPHAARSSAPAAAPPAKPRPRGDTMGLRVHRQIRQHIGEAPLRLGPPGRDVLGRHLVGRVAL